MFVIVFQMISLLLFNIACYVFRDIADVNSTVKILFMNKGLYKTREIGLAKATGEYVGWCDADDFVEPQMYERLYQAAETHHSEMSYCDYSWFPEKIKTKEKWFREYQGKADVNFVERNSQPWNKIVKRELLERLEVGKYFVSCS